MTSDDAIQIATSHEGRASLTTAIINSCGYGVLLLSEYKPTAWFGGLLALTMLVAFLAEVLILPATIKLLPQFFGSEALGRGRAGAIVAALLLVVAAGARSAGAQPLPTGYVSVFADYLPNRADTVEVRARIFAEEKIEVNPRFRVTASGFAEGIAARRPVEMPSSPGLDARQTSAVRDAVFRVHEAHVELRGGRADLVAGLARVVWGRLDEIQPTDVINPLDVSRFFFEGRSEARLPVALLRGRLFLTDGATIEAVYVPVFRRGRFDQLQESTAPFAIDGEPEPVFCLAIGCPTLPPAVITGEPALRLRNGQGGLRFSATTARIDWSVSAYRGFEAFAHYAAVAAPPVDGRLLIRGTHPRFTLFAADFETVRGAWGIRGEVAAAVEDSFQSPAPAVVAGSSIDAGIGVDRRAGDYRISATVLFRREAYETPMASRDSRDDVSAIVSAERTFRRERYRLRAFGVANAGEGSGFARGIASAELRDNVALEASTGWFLGRGRDLIGRFFDRDFFYLRLKYFF
jgi:hypothetical protein